MQNTTMSGLGIQFYAYKNEIGGFYYWPRRDNFIYFQNLKAISCTTLLERKEVPPEFENLDVTSFQENCNRIHHHKYLHCKTVLKLFDSDKIRDDHTRKEIMNVIQNQSLGTKKSVWLVFLTPDLNNSMYFGIL